MNKIKNRLLFAFGSAIAVLILVMVLNTEYSKKSASTHDRLELRIEPALDILNNFHTYNKELFLLSLNKVTAYQDAGITNRIKIITEVELPHLNKKAIDLVSSFPPDDPKLKIFDRIIAMSNNSILTSKDIYKLLRTKNDYADPEKLLKARNILNNKLTLENTEINHAIAALQLDFNQENKSKRAEFRNQLTDLSRIILITGTIAILIGIVIAHKTIRSIVGPIEILKDGSKRISKGEYEHRVKIKGSDELTVLGNSFNEMAGSLDKSFDSIKRKNKELEQFVYIASHDLQEPLRTIRSFTKLLSEQFKGKLDETGDHYIHFIVQASTRMQYLVKDLMDYSRLGNDKNLESIDCTSLVLGVRDDLSELMKENDGKLVLGNLPEVQGYKTSLRLLFQNLINNAMKFQKPNVKPIVEVFHEENENFWQFGVKDNGIGIEEQHIEKIFSIFKRLHSQNEYEGTGIGLAHCQKVVEMHKGKIWVTSAPGNGSTFYFTLARNIKVSVDHEILPTP